MAALRAADRNMPAKQPIQHGVTRAFFLNLLIHPADIRLQPVATRDFLCFGVGFRQIACQFSGSEGSDAWRFADDSDGGIGILTLCSFGIVPISALKLTTL